MHLSNARLEVMRFLGQKIDSIVEDFLKPIDTNWQPTDFLPDSTSENFLPDVKLLQESCRDLPAPTLKVASVECEGSGSIDVSPQGNRLWIAHK